MGYDYICRLEEGSTVSWTAGIDTLRINATGQYEAEINGRGTYFHVIAGRHKYGNFLCIPNHSIGCEPADFSNSFWITERLCMYAMQKVDAITVATGISHLKEAASALK